MKSALVATLFLNLILAYALGDQNANVRQLIADREHMLAQRLSVLEVEQFIERANPKLDKATRRGYAEILVDASNEYHIPHKLLAAVAYTESRFRHTATGDGGRSHGIFQLQGLWIKEIPFVNSERDLYEPAINIRAGAWVLRYMADRCGFHNMLSCYNAGENNPDAARHYEAKVMSEL